MEIIWFILIGLVAGWLAGQIIHGSGFGIIGDIVLGVLGALPLVASCSTPCNCPGVG